MDPNTLQFYASHARDTSARYRAQAPSRLYTLVQAFFHPGGATADIGVGSGRDAVWLMAEEYPTVGYDASPEMIAEAREHYPYLQLEQSSLPDLAQIEAGRFANVLCCATLMHVRREDLITAVLNLARILGEGGRLVVSYRQGFEGQERGSDGRLFTRVAPGELALLFESAGLRLLHIALVPDALRPDVQWHVFAFEKAAASASPGLERIQAILAQDRKVATYKFALVRALCAVSRTQRHLVHWLDDGVHVPLWSIAMQWLIYYWPLVNHTGFIAQIQAEKPTGAGGIAFRTVLRELATRPDIAGLWDLLRLLDENPNRFRAELGVIARTIRNGPVTHAGGGDTPVFGFRPPVRSATAGTEESFGRVVVPEAVWLDICRFEHWIEDSIVVRWARMSAELNPAAPLGMGGYLPLLLAGPGAERDTGEARRLLQQSDRPLVCVWTAAALDGGYQVDHLLPYSVWGNNDLWNLLPCKPDVNLKKSDALPKLSKLAESQARIFSYWEHYRSLQPVRFDTQVQRALGCSVGEHNWLMRAFAGLVENIERLAISRGLRRWPK